MTACIDTLKLSIPAPSMKIGSKPSLVLKPGQFDLATGKTMEYPLFTTSNGKQYFGDCAYHNSDLFNLTINGRGTFLQCSIPKVAHGENFSPVTREETLKAIGKVEKALADIGIRTSLNDSILSRIDIAKTIKSKFRFMDYSRLFQIMRAKRMSPRDYGTTYNFMNGSREICLYDKVIELQNTGYIPADLGATGNRLRCEIRNKNKRTLTRLCGFNSTSDLLKSLEDIPDIYQESLKADFFRNAPTLEERGPFGTMEDCESELRRYERIYGNRFFQYWSQDQGLITSMNIYTLDIIVESALRVSKRGNKRSLRKDIFTRIQRALFNNDTKNKVSIADMYQELYTKLAA